MKNLRLICILLAVPVLLLVPLIAMGFTQEVNWTLLDFVAAAVLLLSAGLACELVLRKFRTAGSRIVLCGAILAVLGLVWGELATGFFEAKLTGVPPTELRDR